MISKMLPWALAVELVKMKLSFARRLYFGCLQNVSRFIPNSTATSRCTTHAPPPVPPAPPPLPHAPLAPLRGRKGGWLVRPRHASRVLNPETCTREDFVGSAGDIVMGVVDSRIDAKAGEEIDAAFNKLPDSIWFPGLANWIFSIIGVVMTWDGAVADPQKSTVMVFGILFLSLGGLIFLVVTTGYCCLSSYIDKIVAAKLEEAIRGQNHGTQNFFGISVQFATDDHIIDRARNLISDRIFALTAFTCGPQIMAIVICIIVVMNQG